MVLRSPDHVRVRALLDGRVEVHEGDRLVVRHADAAGLAADLVAAGVRVAELATERHSLEEVVLRATSAGSDDFSRPRGEAS